MTDVNIAPQSQERYHHGDLPRALVEASIQLIEDHGPEAFTVREVARRIGVSHAAPYRHFADKRSLLAAAAAHGFNELADTAREAFESEDEAVEGFLALGRAYVRFAASHPVLFRLMFDSNPEDSGGELTAAKDGAFGVLLGSVAAAQQAGALQPLDLLDAAITAWSTVHGFALLVIDRVFEQRLRAIRSLDAWADKVTRLALAGMRVPAVTEPTEAIEDVE